MIYEKQDTGLGRVINGNYGPVANRPPISVVPDQFIWVDPVTGVTQAQGGTWVTVTPNAASLLAETGGQAGAYAPTIRQGLFSNVVLANFVYFGRFVAPVSFNALSIRFALTAAAGSNDSCGAAIYSADGTTRLVSSGSVAGKLNATAGPQSLPIASTPLVAGTVYQVAFWSGPVGSTGGSIAMTGMNVANGAANLAGVALTAADYGVVAGAAIPASLSGTSPWSYGPYLFVGQS